MSRQKYPTDKLRTMGIRVPVTPQENEAYKELAYQQGMPLTAYIRKLLNESLKAQQTAEVGEYIKERIQASFGTEDR